MPYTPRPRCLAPPLPTFMRLGCPRPILIGICKWYWTAPELLRVSVTPDSALAFPDRAELPFRSYRSQPSPSAREDIPGMVGMLKDPLGLCFRNDSFPRSHMQTSNAGSLPVPLKQDRAPPPETERRTWRKPITYHRKGSEPNSTVHQPATRSPICGELSSSSQNPSSNLPSTSTCFSGSVIAFQSICTPPFLALSSYTLFLNQ